MSSSTALELPALLSSLTQSHSRVSALPDQAPPVPNSLEEAGVSVTSLEQLLIKTLYVKGEMIGRELANSVGLKFSLIEPLLEAGKRTQTIQMKRSVGMGNVSGYFSLTEAGRHHAREFLEMNQYVGPVPVPLEQYTKMVRRQRQPSGWLTPEALEKAYSKMVLGPDILSKIGPAVSSGQSFLIYGQPGNGKTYLAEALVKLDTSHIFMPYAIECQGSIVQVYDQLFHKTIEEDESPSAFSAVSMEPSFDRRWFRCHRPFIVSGGELTLDMLDLTYNPVSKIYDAPLHLKANNGIYLIDDFGRQRVTPAEVLNRWIVPMERRVDYLTLRTGGKVTVPFDAFIVISTNLRPDQLGDEAFLRRIQYKMHLRNPLESEFVEIFRRFCSSNSLQTEPGLIEQFVESYYRKTGKKMRRCHPRDILTHALSLIHFERRPMKLTNEILHHAFGSCFAEISDMEA